MDLNHIENIEFGDIGIEVPNIDASLIDFINADETEETRYTKPKAVNETSQQVMYDNAMKFARSIHISTDYELTHSSPEISCLEIL